MPQAIMLVLGAALGFLGSRLLRRPANVATAASVARNVGGALGRRRGLALPELQRAAFSEMMRHVRVSVTGATVVPTTYVVHLNPADATAVEEAPRFFTNGLIEALRGAANEYGWTIDGPVSVDVEVDSARRPGAPAVHAVPAEALGSAAAAPPPDALATVSARRTAEHPIARAPVRPPAGPRQLMLHRIDTDERVSLTTDTVSIGRAADQTMVVEDSRVSRHHAVVRPHGGGWAVVDQGSSNGTRLNGSKLIAQRPARLRLSDTVEIGPVQFTFDVDPSSLSEADPVTAASTAEPTTMTLDDATRHRLSVEYLHADAERSGEGQGRAGTAP